MYMLVEDPPEQVLIMARPPRPGGDYGPMAHLGPEFCQVHIRGTGQDPVSLASLKAEGFELLCSRLGNGFVTVCVQEVWL